MLKEEKDLTGKLSGKKDIDNTKIPATPAAEEQNTTSEEPDPSPEEIKNIAAEQPEAASNTPAEKPETTENSDAGTAVKAKGAETASAESGRKEAPAPANRAELLKRNLVEAYKAEKGKTDAADADKAATTTEESTDKGKDPVSAAVPEADLKKKDKEVKDAKAGKAESAEDKKEEKEASGEKSEGGEEKEDKEEKKPTLASLFGTAKAIAGSIYQNYKDRKKIKNSKTAETKKGARREFWKGLGDTMKHLSGGASSGLKLFGSSEDQKSGSKYLDMITTAAGSIGSFMSMAAGISAKREHKKIAGSAQSWMDKLKDTPAGREAELSKSVKEAKGTDAYGAKRKERNDFKAKKYAMSIAHDFNKMKGNQMVKGGFDFATSLIGTAKKGLSFASDNFLQSKVGTGLSMGLDVLGKVLDKVGGAAEKKSDENQAKASKEAQLKHVNEYIAKGTEKLQVGEDAIFKGISEDEKGNYGSGELTANEKERIVIARLGVDVEILDEPLTDEEKQAAFKLLAMKRAKNILNASPDTKKEMLKSLGLGDSAKAEDVVAAMVGE